MRNDTKQGQWPNCSMAGEVPHIVPNGIARHEGDRPDAPSVLIKGDNGGFVLKPTYTWGGNRTGEG